MAEITILGELSFKETTLRLIRGLFTYVGSLEEVICLALANVFGCFQPPLLQTVFPPSAVQNGGAQLKNKRKDLYFSHSGGSALNAALARGQ